MRFILKEAQSVLFALVKSEILPADCGCFGAKHKV